MLAGCFLTSPRFLLSKLNFKWHVDLWEISTPQLAPYAAWIISVIYCLQTFIVHSTLILKQLYCDTTWDLIDYKHNPSLSPLWLSTYNGRLCELICTCPRLYQLFSEIMEAFEIYWSLSPPPPHTHTSAMHSLYITCESQCQEGYRKAVERGVRGSD